METFDDGPDTLPMLPTFGRDALDRVLDGLGPDEIRVLTRIAERLELGAVTYGRLQLVVDERSFREVEAREEVEDALVYLACAWLKAEGGAR